MTRRELFLTPLAALVLRMAQRSLPAAAAKPISPPKYHLTFDIGVGEKTVVSVIKRDVVVGFVELLPGKHHVEIPLEEALSNYHIKADKPMTFAQFNYRIIDQQDGLVGSCWTGPSYPAEKYAFCTDHLARFL